MSYSLAEAMTRYGVKTAIEKYGLDTVGMWDIHGEDPNCDMGGYHSEPYLGEFYGTLRDCIAYANDLPGFWGWGSGGSFKLNKTSTKAKLVSNDLRDLMEFTNALVLVTPNVAKMKKMKGYDAWQKVARDLAEEEELLKSEQEVARLMAEKQALDAKIAKLRKK